MCWWGPPSCDVRGRTGGRHLLGKARPRRPGCCGPEGGRPGCSCPRGRGQGAEMGRWPSCTEFLPLPPCFFTTWAGSWQQSEQGGVPGRFLKTGLAVPVLSCLLPRTSSDPLPARTRFVLLKEVWVVSIRGGGRTWLEPGQSLGSPAYSSLAGRWLLVLFHGLLTGC